MQIPLSDKSFLVSIKPEGLAVVKMSKSNLLVERFTGTFPRILVWTPSLGESQIGILGGWLRKRQTTRFPNGPTFE